MWNLKPLLIHFLHPVTLKPIGLPCTLDGFFFKSVSDFITLCIGHLENNDSLKYPYLPYVDLQMLTHFNYIIFLKIIFLNISQYPFKMSFQVLESYWWT